MPLNWDDDEEEELTELEYRKRPKRVLVHEEVTAPPEETPLSPQLTVFRKESVYASPQSLPPTESTPSTPSAHGMGLVPAPARDRFAAFLIDTLLGLYLYIILGFILDRFFETPNLKTLHQSTGRLWIHLGLTLSALFFYYLLMESVFGATLGKLFCRLRVVETNGQPPSLGSAFLRNFLRILDYPLAFLIAVISMESSPLNQRLGDRAANTVVIKKTRRPMPTVDLRHIALASTFSRIMAELVDLLIALTLAYSFILLMSPKHILFSYLLYLSSPVAFLAYYTLTEFLLGTTPGKALFRRQVVLENGLPPDGTGALLRNLFRPLDYILGYPLLVLSKKKQRLGDMAADTLVVVRPSSRKGALGSAGAVLLVLLIAYFGFTNKENFIRKDYGLGPLEGIKIFLPPLRKSLKPAKEKSEGIKKSAPAEEKTASKKRLPPSKLPQTTSDRLKLLEFYFATGPQPSQIRYDRKFKEGDLVYLFFKVEGFELSPTKETSLGEDLKLEDPSGKTILNQQKIVQLKKHVEEASQGILFANNIDIPKNSTKGTYRVIITIHDQNAGTQFSFDRDFEIQ